MLIRMTGVHPVADTRSKLPSDSVSGVGFQAGAAAFLLGIAGLGNLAGAPRDMAPDLEVPYSAPENYVAHSKLFRKQVTKVGDTPVWQLQFHGQNLVVIEGQTGLIVVDTGTSREVATAALAEIRARITTKPVEAIIYTHHHMDHVNGASVFVDPKEVTAGKVPIFAAGNFLKEISDEGVATVPIVAARSTYMYGFALQGAQDGAGYHVGCCGGLGELTANTSGYIPPSQFVDVDGTRDVEIAGVSLHLFYTGGEAASHIAVWLPQYKVLISGDEVQGPTFPNLHSMRGTKMRDANRWIKALRRMQTFDAAYMVPLHGPVVSSAATIRELLSRYEDAIQYTHDQSIRLINQGVTLKELPQALGGLPSYLRSEPYTTEYYGTAVDAARSYYVGYISWFSGDATELAPTPPLEAARRTVELMGGRERVLAAARDAFGADDVQWAAELATLLIRIDREDVESRQLKAVAFRRLGYASYNSTWRGFYLMGALELEGKLGQEEMTQRYVSTDFVTRLPVPSMFESIRYRIDPEIARDQDIRLMLDVGPEGRWFLHLRNSTLKVAPVLVPPRDMATVVLDRAALGELASGKASVDELVNIGRIRGEGVEKLVRLFGAIDFTSSPIRLVVR